MLLSRSIRMQPEEWREFDEFQRLLQGSSLDERVTQAAALRALMKTAMATLVMAEAKAKARKRPAMAAARAAEGRTAEHVAA